MSFLSRREPKPLPAFPPKFPPAVESKAQHAGSNGRTSARLMKHVSHLFSHRKKRHVRDGPTEEAVIPGTRVTPIIIDRPASSRWQVTTDTQSFTDSEDSEDDIRRPSGLGRSVSFSSNRSMPPSPFTPIDKTSPFYVAPESAYERSRTVSAPNMLRPHGILKTKTGFSAPFSDVATSVVVPQLPNEVLLGILGFLPRHDIGYLARTSREFCRTARIVLYDHLDFRTLQPTQIEDLVTLLAYRRDLADLVRTLECHTWPAFFPPYSGASTLHSPSFPPLFAPSFSPALTAIFTITFQNMTRVTSLVLPSFDPIFLRHHSAFGLKKITFLAPSMCAVEKTQLFTWLDGQTNITHLALPNLMDKVPPPTHLDVSNGVQNRNSAVSSDTVLGAMTPAYVASAPASPSLPPCVPDTPPELGPLYSPTLLPSLTTIAATPSIITSLIHSTMSTRPVRDITLNINETLYTGLRPSTLMNDLRSLGLARLALRFGPAVDRRTVGKVLTAGAVLFNNARSSGRGERKGEKGGGGGDAPKLMELDVELADGTEGADQALYKVLNTILPRFHDLFNLQLRFSPDVVPAETQRPLPVPTAGERDDAQSQLWSKHCPSLQTVRLLSGVVWKRA